MSDAELKAAEQGTVQDGDMVYQLDGKTYRTPIKTLCGDYRLPDGTTGNRLRRWEQSDFKPRPDDIFQERLYCIQMDQEGNDRHRPPGPIRSRRIGEDIESLGEKLDEYINAQRTATGFDLRYTSTMAPLEKDWRDYTEVLSRRDLIALMSTAWG